jgi:hypothetical protein
LHVDRGLRVWFIGCIIVRPEATQEEIWEALKLAAAEGFVSELPDGLETILGDRGVRLSEESASGSLWCGRCCANLLC